VVELVTEYLSHAMPAEDTARLEQHLFTCPQCTAYLEQMRTVIGLAGELDENAPPPASDALEVFRRWKKKPS
jgi:anti-sigma factor RsiW